jgi:hypothetical protein
VQASCIGVSKFLLEGRNFQNPPKLTLANMAHAGASNDRRRLPTGQESLVGLVESFLRKFEEKKNLSFEIENFEIFFFTNFDLKNRLFFDFFFLAHTQTRKIGFLLDVQIAIGSF